MDLMILYILIGVLVLLTAYIFYSYRNKPPLSQYFGKILVVDDTIEILKFLEIILTKAGYTVKCISSGVEAEKNCKTEKFDLILMDIFMPDLNGLSVAKSIRTDGVNQKTHLIALTACENKELAFTHFEAGFDEAMQKPISPEKLLHKVSLVMAKIEQFKSADRGEPIVSNYKNDPQYRNTVNQFVKSLPEKVKEIEQDLYDGQLEQLKKKVHSLKGIGGFAGFPIFSEKAKVIEEKLTENKIEDVRKQVNELILLCKNTRLNQQK